MEHTVGPGKSEILRCPRPPKVSVVGTPVCVCVCVLGSLCGMCACGVYTCPSVAPALRGGVGGHGPMPPLQSLPRQQCQQDPGPSTPCHRSASHPRARLSGLLNPQVETADRVGAKVNAEARKWPPTICTLLGGGAAPREVARPLGGWGQGGPQGRGGSAGAGLLRGDGLRAPPATCPP